MTNPEISVILPVYNAESFLKEAIQSILDQSYKNFELIIINDGSSDTSENIIHSFKDPRIRYFNNKKNLGLAMTLNKGLEEAKGFYIARMDADDISQKDRLQKQVNFLKNNTDYGIVGSLYITLDPERKPYEIGGMDFRYDNEIKLSLFSNNVFAHGEVMFRNDLVQKYNLSYDPSYNPCEDYDLWVKMSHMTKFHILDEILYFYMINPNSMSGKGWKKMKTMIKKIARELQSEQKLPHLPTKTLINFYKNGRSKKDDQVKYQTTIINRYHQLNYQEFLFRTGFVYLKHINLQGIELLLVSFVINPMNWILKFYRIFFKKDLRLKKGLYKTSFSESI